MSRNGLMIAMVALGIFGADADCGGTQLFGKYGSRNYTGTMEKKCIWEFTREINQTTAIFIQLGSNKLWLDRKCHGDVRPTGVGKEIRLCEWSPPVCFIIAYPESRCSPSMYFEKHRDCKQFSWINKNSTKDVRFWRNAHNGDDSLLSFSFAYEYIDCQGREALTSTQSSEPTRSHTTIVDSTRKSVMTTAATPDQQNQRVDRSTNFALVVVICVVGGVCFLLIIVSTTLYFRVRHYKLKALAPTSDKSEERPSYGRDLQQSSTAEIVVNELYEERYAVAKESNAIPNPEGLYETLDNSLCGE